MSATPGDLAHARAHGGAFPVPEGIRLRVSGADALRYLNGQITRDLKRLRDGEALPACLLTPKGKLCAAITVIRDGADLIVEADAGVGDALAARLERYLVADDAVIAPEPWPARVHLFAGEESGMPGEDPPGVSVSRLGVPGKDVPAEAAAGRDATDPAVVEILRIGRGVPAWGAELTADILPPEAGLDRTLIDYDRGCYPGQEVMSRLRSIGRVNRLLHGFRGEGLRAGAAVRNGEGKEIGTLTSAARLPGSDSCEALGYLPRGASEPLFSVAPLTGEISRLSIVSVFGT